MQIHPLTPERWDDFVDLFGERGAYAGCWCMYWRISRSAFISSSGEQRKASMRALVEGGTIPGLLLYADGTPIGWCSLGPRESFPPLERSKTLKRVDPKKVWSIVCFFIDKKHRKQGAMEALLEGALTYAQSQGANIVEAYPTDLQSEALAGKHLTGYQGFMGVVSTFRRAGFVEVGRASETQTIMRYFFQDELPEEK